MMNVVNELKFITWYMERTPEEKEAINFILNIISVDMLNNSTELLEKLQNDIKTAEAVEKAKSVHHSLNWYGVDKRIKEGKWGT
jgi:hypothetical protein